MVSCDFRKVFTISDKIDVGPLETLRKWTVFWEQMIDINQVCHSGMISAWEFWQVNDRQSPIIGVLFTTFSDFFWLVNITHCHSISWEVSQRFANQPSLRCLWDVAWDVSKMHLRCLHAGWGKRRKNRYQTFLFLFYLDSSILFQIFCPRLYIFTWGCTLNFKSFKRQQKQPLEVFCKKAVLANFGKLTGNYLCQSLLLNEVAGLLSFSRKTLWSC